MTQKTCVFDTPFCQSDMAIIVGNSTVDIDFLAEWAQKTGADVFAADGGVVHCVAAGLMPKAVFGDMDSVSQPLVGSSDLASAWHHILDQDTTDLDKLLRHLKASRILGFGFMDGRFDHALGVLTTLSRYADTQHIVMLGEYDAMLVCRSGVTVQTDIDVRFSLWPLGEVICEASEGLLWPLNGLTFSPEEKTSTSNKTSAACQSITLAGDSEGAYALIVEKRFAAALLEAKLVDR